MIDYDEEWIFKLVFRKDGSLALRASLYAVPAAIVAVLLVLLDDWLPSFRENSGMTQVSGGQVWSASTATLALLLGFRTREAMSRFWEGTSLLHQMRGEWFDAVSCCVTFSRSTAEGKNKDDVMRFRHTLVRLMSLCHGSALEEIKEHESDSIETIDVAGLDYKTLKLLNECKEIYNFNRVEMLLHLSQGLITKAHDDGVMKIAPPILSRVYQTLSRGFVNLLNAKKITDTRFPFPFAQLITTLLLLHIILTPLMISTVFKAKFFAFLFTFLPIFGMFSLNFIASELENPFGNDDNDLPLDHFQTEMNNCLLMLLHTNSDHIADLSPECVMDFTALTQTRAVRLSHCKDKENEFYGGLMDSKCVVGRVSLRTLVKKDDHGLDLPETPRSAEALQNSGTSRSPRSPRGLTQSQTSQDNDPLRSPRSPRVIIRPNQSKIVVVNDQASSGQTSPYPSLSGMSVLPAGSPSSAGPVVPEVQQVASPGETKVLEAAQPKEPKMQQVLPQDVLGLQPTLAESMDRFNNTLQEWSKKVEDQMSVVSRNTVVLQSFCDSLPKVLDAVKADMIVAQPNLPRGFAPVQPRPVMEEDAIPTPARLQPVGVAGGPKGRGGGGSASGGGGGGSDGGDCGGGLGFSVAAQKQPLGI